MAAIAATPAHGRTRSSPACYTPGSAKASASCCCWPPCSVKLVPSRWTSPYRSWAVNRYQEIFEVKPFGAKWLLAGPDQLRRYVEGKIAQTNSPYVRGDQRRIVPITFQSRHDSDVMIQMITLNGDSSQRGMIYYKVYRRVKINLDPEMIAVIIGAAIVGAVVARVNKGRGPDKGPLPQGNRVVPVPPIFKPRQRDRFKVLNPSQPRLKTLRPAIVTK
jgi:hypothetical protein